MPPGQPRWFGFDIQLSKDASNNPEPELPMMEDDKGAAIKFRYVKPHDVFKDTQMFPRDNGEDVTTHFSDVNQGRFPNCWLMAALSIVARYAQAAQIPIIESLFSDISKDKVTVKLNVRSTNPKDFGQWGVRSFKQTISTKMVFTGSGVGAPAFVKSDAPGELWPPMLEKAVAAALVRDGETGFTAMGNGFAAMGVGMFISGWPLRYLFGQTPPTPENLFPAWSLLLGSGIAITAAWRYYNKGLITQHQYAVLALVEVEGKQLVMFRNPWGRGTCEYNEDSDSGEWTGDWSDCSPQWKKYPKVAKACRFMPRNDGVFWMCAEDICANLRDYDVFVPDSDVLRKCDLRKVPTLGSGTGVAAPEE